MVYVLVLTMVSIHSGTPLVEYQGSFSSLETCQAKVTEMRDTLPHDASIDCLSVTLPKKGK